jgi:hypothetical protein
MFYSSVVAVVVEAPIMEVLVEEELVLLEKQLLNQYLYLHILL